MTAPDHIAQILSDMLIATRRADFAALAGLAEKLDAALPDLHGTPQAIAAIRHRAARNISALQAAAAGIRAAERRLAEIRQMGRLTTYDHSGARHDRAATLPPTRRL